MCTIFRLYFILLLSTRMHNFVVLGEDHRSERWCQLSPSYTRLTISPRNSETIFCIVPTTNEYRDVHFVNQYGEAILLSDGLPNVNFTPVVSNSNVSILRIQWTSDKAAQEKLSVIQCIATFQGSTIPCKTSIVTVNFSSNEQEPTTLISPAAEQTECVCTPSKCTTRQSPDVNDIEGEQLLQSANHASQNYHLPSTLNFLLFCFFFLMTNVE